MDKVPSTVEEVERTLRATVSDNVAADSMIGIFRVRMKMGDDLLQAYEAALKAYINVADKRQPNSQPAKRTEGRNDS